jgi:hypothetical protein
VTNTVAQPGEKNQAVQATESNTAQASAKRLAAQKILDEVSPHPEYARFPLADRINLNRRSRRTDDEGGENSRQNITHEWQANFAKRIDVQAAIGRTEREHI